MINKRQIFVAFTCLNASFYLTNWSLCFFSVTSQVNTCKGAGVGSAFSWTPYLFRVEHVPCSRSLCLPICVLLLTNLPVALFCLRALSDLLDRLWLELQLELEPELGGLELDWSPAPVAFRRLQLPGQARLLALPFGLSLPFCLLFSLSLSPLVLDTHY